MRQSEILYTFETYYANMDGSVWLRSQGRWKNIEGAAKGAAGWLAICAENASICAVRVVSVEELPIED